LLQLPPEIPSPGSEPPIVDEPVVTDLGEDLL
jgi:hypothetical protein